MSDTSIDRSTRRRSRIVRLSALAAVLVVSTVLGVLHQDKTAAWLPVGVDALCPFGGIETLWAYLAGGLLIKKIALSSIVLLVATVGTALVMGRSFCGQICPLGALQEFFGRLGKRILGRQLELPRILDKPARWLKYVVLAVATIGTWYAGDLVFRGVDPWVAYHHLTSTELLSTVAVGLVVLIVTVIGSLVYDRFFCKYACPMGAALAIMSRVSWFKVRRDESVCTSCGRCDKACPVGIDVMHTDTVRSAECISCAECVNACPFPEALKIADRGGRSISPLVLTIATLAVFFGVIGVSTALDTFEWSMPTVASAIQEATTGSGTFDSSVIKGWMTMSQIAADTGIPAAQMQQDFGLSAEEMDVALGEVKDDKDFTMEDVRAYVEANISAP